jgi:hypothetical protein
MIIYPRWTQPSHTKFDLQISLFFKSSHIPKFQEKKLDTVGALLALDAVGALLALDAVGALLALDAVGALLALDAVGALLALDVVGALLALDAVGALLALDVVGALLALEAVGALLVFFLTWVSLWTLPWDNGINESSMAEEDRASAELWLLILERDTTKMMPISITYFGPIMLKIQKAIKRWSRNYEPCHNAFVWSVH